MATSKLPNQFEVFNLVVKQRRNSILREGFAYAVAFVCLLSTLLALARPLPVVVKSDRPDEPTTIAYATGDNVIRDIDAKKFLFKTTRMLHGWSSGTVLGDLEEASLLMTPKWREQFLANVNEKVDVETNVDSSGKAERVVVWAKSLIRNKVDLAWKKTECLRSENRWHCRARGVLSAGPISARDYSPAQEKAVEVRASFVEVPVTQLTMDGLLIDFFDLIEVNA